MAATFGRTIAIATLTACVVAGPANAGPADVPSSAPQAGPSASAPAKPQEQKVQAAPGGTSAIVMDISAIQGLIGRSVTSSAGEDMGRIVDLLVTPSGVVRAAVIDFGGFLGVGSRKVAVDWKALSFLNMPKGGAIRLALTRDQVRVSPEYKSGDPVVILETTKPSDARANAAAAPLPQPPASSDPAASDPKAPGAAGK